jgi:hypothetical protein
MGTRHAEAALTAAGFSCWEVADQLAATRWLGPGVKHAVLHAHPGHVARLSAVAESLAGAKDLDGRLSALVTSAGLTAPVLHTLDHDSITLAVLLQPTGTDVCTTAYGYAAYTVDLPPPVALDGLRRADEHLRYLYPNRHQVPYVRPSAIQGASVRFLLTLPPLLPHERAVLAVRTHLGPDAPALRPGPAYPPVTLGHSSFADLLREVDPAIGWRHYDGRCEAHVFQQAGIPVVIHGPDRTTHTLTAALRRWFLDGGD